MKAKNRWGRVAGLLCIAVAVLAFAGATSAESGKASITFRRLAWVSAPEIRLAAVADIETSDEELGRWLGGISLGTAPSPRRTKELSPEYLLARLRMQHVDLSATDVQFPDRIRVARTFAVVSPERLQELFVRYVKANSYWQDARIEVGQVEPLAEVAVPDGVLTCRISPPRQQQLIGKVELPVTLLLDGVECGNLQLTGYVKVIQQVVHTKSPIQRGAVLEEEDLVLQDADVTLLPSGYFTDMGEVVGKRARRAIRAHEVVHGKFLEAVPLVRRGDMVSLVVDNRYVRVTAPGQVGEDGFAGQMVKVLNVASNRYVYGRVAAANTVKVEY